MAKLYQRLLLSVFFIVVYFGQVCAFRAGHTGQSNVLSKSGNLRGYIHPLQHKIRNVAKNSKLHARKTKEIVLSDDCRNRLLHGIEQVANAVRVTLGPRGRNVLLEKEYGPPIIVNDGVTIARSIELKDRKENAGAKLVQEVASTSDDRAGDGTTSTSILTYEICKEGVSYVNQKHNPIPLQKGIEKASRMLMDEVKRLSKPVEGYSDLLNIATVATSGNVEMGEVIAKAFEKLGVNAATVLEDNPALEDKLEFTEGYSFDRGLASPYFLVGEDKETIEWQQPHILVCDFKIESAQSILHILEHYLKTKEPLILIADDYGTEVMQTLIINKMRGLLKVAAIKAPSFGERRKDYLRDIAVASNATLVSNDIGMNLEDITPSSLGRAQRIVIRKERTSILTDSFAQPAIQERMNKLKRDREDSTSKYDREKLDERIAALSGGIAQIMIGASTETEQKSKKLKYEDAINAVRAALETGYVPGGGVTYLEVSTPEFEKKVMQEVEQNARKEMNQMIDERNYSENVGAEEMESEIELQQQGARIVLHAMTSITKQIAENAGVNGERVVSTIRKAGKPFGFGWNAKTAQFGDMIDMGVIDPAKVIINAIENSASVAGLILTTEGMLVEDETRERETEPRDAEPQF